MRTRNALLFQITVLTGILAWCIWWTSSPPPPEDTAKTVGISIVHTPETKAYLSHALKNFQERIPKLPDGSEFRYELHSVVPYVAARSIARGELKPHAWLAPSSAFVKYVNHSLENLGVKQEDCIPLFSTPVVVATSPTRKDAFRPTGPFFSWERFFSETDQRHIAMNHGAPHLSLTGASALLQMAHLATRSQTLTVSSLELPEMMKRLEEFESLAINYDLSESVLLSQTATSTSKRTAFTITTEQQLFEWNGQKPDSAVPLIPLYMEEGTYIQDYQFCLSSPAGTPVANRVGALEIAKFLTSRAAPLLPSDFGFRNPDLSLPTQSKLRRALSEAPLHLRSHFEAPAPEGFRYLLEHWRGIMKPVALLIVLDTSGSMAESYSRPVKNLLRSFLARTSKRDLKALITFSTEPQLAMPFGSDIGKFFEQLDATQSLGGSALYDALRNSFEIFQSEAERLQGHRKAMVVLTDGGDKNSLTSFEDLIAYIRGSPTTADINTTIIGLGGAASDFSDLHKVSEAARGTFRQAQGDTLEDVFVEISRRLGQG